jgi:ubiquitin carboxyl-terminal hydrolase 10
VPWLSVPESLFPSRAPHRRRKGRPLPSSALSVELPAKEIQRTETLPSDHVESQSEAKLAGVPAPPPSEPQTPITSHAPSEADSTHPTTPSSATPPQPILRTSTQPQPHAKSAHPTAPLVPVVPILPPSPHTPRHLPRESGRPIPLTPKSSATPSACGDSVTEASQDGVAGLTAGPSAPHGTDEPATSVSPPRVVPKSWADLVRSKANPRSAPSTEAAGLTISKNESLVDVLNNLGPDVNQYGEKIAFLEPRGLVNTGNMCYMNSVGQKLRSHSWFAY